ncbi:glycosyltransferase family 2 protein [Flavobacterium procerum]|uniref:Glycosyltransferase family 2 protein n=1 Tax=Flavobacterium procerum TaxID=1455569 RepID=A0ABV6BK66_9FLAO
MTNRNRDLNIVKKCLDSLKNQSNDRFELFFVDYGSDENYFIGLKELLHSYPKINFIDCPVSGQLWNKCRAINIALKKCKTDFFFVGDIDMIYHPDFVNRLYELKEENTARYFQVGFLDKNQSDKNGSFEAYQISFNSTDNATGMTLYPTELLKQINGFDEFYHGWGSEDTDVHIRLKNLGIPVEYYDREILMLHQWHPKLYRSVHNKAAFHSSLEKINSRYLIQTQELKKTKANLNFDWGIIPNKEDYIALENPDVFISITNEKATVDALLRGTLVDLKNSIAEIEIKMTADEDKTKNLIKRFIGRKYTEYYELQTINNLLLEAIISFYRNAPYQYSINENKIRLTIKK